ncbi:MAG: methyltransferase domain-containing protein, partial [Hyphomicrobiales bacterium]|nr:methyltransferase domain-containing protein [Hyphomicrobiales bacterium]
HAVTQSFDQADAEAFADRMAEMLNTGAVASMVSIGHRAGLFNVLAKLAPSTSAEIAAAAALDERYIREWLAVMVTGRIVTYDPVRKTYSLPAEHAASLTPGAAFGNLAVYSQFIAQIGQLQDRILECFESGDGLAYGDYPHFHTVMAEDSDQTVGTQIFDAILPLVDGMVDRLEAGIDVLDAGCGRGAALIAMAKRFPNSRFVGYDLGEDAIAHARGEARAAGLSNIRFEARDLTGYDEINCFDFIT